jgi:AcrR family transcriptional regulator
LNQSIKAYDEQVVENKRDALVQATIDTLQERGFPRTTSRAVAECAGVNQALVFYYFGSFDALLLAALDRVSSERLSRYAQALDADAHASELVATLRTIYAEDRESGALVVVSEVVAGSVSDPELGPQVVALMQPWIELVERAAARVLAESPFATLAQPHDVALAVVTFYLGANMVTRLDPDHAGIDGLLQGAEQALRTMGL